MTGGDTEVRTVADLIHALKQRPADQPAQMAISVDLETPGNDTTPTRIYVTGPDRVRTNRHGRIILTVRTDQ